MTNFGHDQNQRRLAFPPLAGSLPRCNNGVDRWVVLGLVGVALLLYGLNLGGVPLRDWDEGLVAQVAREMGQGGGLDGPTWLHPTLQGEPYLNKPPLIHWAIAALYYGAGVHEWTARLPGAVATVASVGLLYGVGRSLFVRRVPAVWGAVVYLTWLPVLRQGRLAMLDGGVLCFSLLLAWGLLRSRRDLRWTWVAGLGLGGLALTKGIVALLMGAIALGFVAWDTPRLLRSPYLWMGGLLGLAPAIAWYAAQGQTYGPEFWQIHFIGQSLQRITSQVDQRQGPPWYYPLELLKYGWPWLIFAPLALRRAWEERVWSWAKFSLTHFLGYGLAVSLMSTKLPWYALPLYPPLALMIGAEIGHWWDRDRAFGWLPLPPLRYPRSWIWPLALLAVASAGGAVYLLGYAEPRDWLVGWAAVAIACTLGVSAHLAVHGRGEFWLVLPWGTAIALALFFSSGQWLWELNEQYPVKPVAALLRDQVPSHTRLDMVYPSKRPSLDFYCDCNAVPLGLEALDRTAPPSYQDGQHRYLLIPTADAPALLAEGERWRSLGQAAPFTLLERRLHP